VKRLLLLVLAFAFGALAPQLRAQSTLPDLLLDDEETETSADSTDGPQRIGIPAASLELDPNEAGAIAGYCFDEHLIAPTRVTTFDNILAGGDAATVRTASGRQVSLRDAVRNGSVAIKAQQLRVMFVNKTDEPMELRLDRPVVLWDRAAGKVNPLALAALEAPDASYDARQRAIWRVTSAERRLRSLGYNTGSIYDFNAQKMRAAMNAFQRDNGLPTTTELDMNTVNRIATVDESMRSRLRSLGFTSRDARFAKEDLGAQIRSYQKFLGRRPSGRWSGDLATSLASTESLLPQLNAIRPAKGQQVADVLAGDNAASVLTYLNNGKGLLVLTETPSGVELWSRNGRSYSFTSRGADAVRSIDDAASKLAQRASKDGRVVLYAGVAKNGTTPVVVGDRTIDVDSRELASFVAGGAVPSALDAAIAPMVPESTSNQWTGGSANTKTFVVYRSPLQQGRASSTLDELGLEQVDGRKLAGALDRAYTGRMALFVSDDLRVGAQRYESSMGSLGVSLREMGLALAE
jgi:peptidoglycan hydrolase-like protein with peptidoglycan-binding domain